MIAAPDLKRDSVTETMKYNHSQELTTILSPMIELIVWIMIFATFTGAEVSATNAAGPPGASRNSMNPWIKRTRPRETCMVEKRNMVIAETMMTRLIFRARCL